MSASQQQAPEKRSLGEQVVCAALAVVLIYVASFVVFKFVTNRQEQQARRAIELQQQHEELQQQHQREWERQIKRATQMPMLEQMQREAEAGAKAISERTKAALRPPQRR